MKKIFKCTECGKTFTLDDCELPEPRTINDDTEHERIVCDTCLIICGTTIISFIVITAESGLRTSSFMGKPSVTIVSPRVRGVATTSLTV